MRLNPWYRCECGKLHVLTYLWTDSACSCGRDLTRQRWRRPSLRRDT